MGSVERMVRKRKDDLVDRVWIGMIVGDEEVVVRGVGIVWLGRKVIFGGIDNVVGIMDRVVVVVKVRMCIKR